MKSEIFSFLIISYLTLNYCILVNNIDKYVKQRGPLAQYLNSPLRAIDSVFSSKTLIEYTTDTKVDSCDFFHSPQRRHRDSNAMKLIASTINLDNQDSTSETYQSKYDAQLLDDGRLCRLTIQTPNHDDSGYVWCRVTNSKGSSFSHEIRLVHTTDILRDHHNNQIDAKIRQTNSTIKTTPSTSSNNIMDNEKMPQMINRSSTLINHENKEVLIGHSIIIPCMDQSFASGSSMNIQSNDHDDSSSITSKERSQFLSFKWNLIYGSGSSSDSNTIINRPNRMIFGDDEEFAIDSNGQLVILQADESLNGSRFICIRTLRYDNNNILEMHGAPVNLTVVKSDTFEQESASNTIIYPQSTQQVILIEGQSYDFKAIFSNRGIIKWKFNSTLLNGDTSHHEDHNTLNSEIKQFGRVLHISNVNSKIHEGTYLAIHESTGDFIEFKAKVKIGPKENIFHDHVIPYGSEIKFNCGQSGKFAKPSVQYRWFINCRDALQLKGVIISKDHSTMVIDSVEEPIVIQCEAVNDFGWALNTSRVIPGHHSTSALSDSFSNYFAAGLNQKASLPCLVESDPNLKLQYSWFRNGSLVVSTTNDYNDYMTNSSSQLTNDIIDDESKMIIQIQKDLKSIKNESKDVRPKEMIDESSDNNDLYITQTYNNDDNNNINEEFEEEEKDHFDDHQRSLFDSLRSNSSTNSKNSRNRFEIKPDDGSLIFRTLPNDEAIYTCRAKSPFDEIEVSLKFLVSEELNSDFGPFWLIVVLICLCLLIIVLIILLIGFYLRQKRVYDLLENERRAGRGSRTFLNSMRTLKTLQSVPLSTISNDIRIENESRNVPDLKHI